MKKSLLWLAVSVIVLIVAASFLVFGADSSTVSALGSVSVATSVSTSSGDVQIVKLSVSGSNYVLEPSSVKAGIPVRLEADVSKMPGCSKGVVMSAFNIRKTFTSSDNTVEFTPDKAGTYNIACSMNMYKGTLTVLSSDGKPSTYVEPPSSKGMSCGASGGGCGCGG